jgi:DNA-binding transcriptional regulator LsrR (DeoR family)
MRKVVDDKRLIFKCCKLYYEENLSQQEIANRLSVSRVSVCRMLQAGREQGIVVVQVLSPDLQEYNKLEQTLEETFGLKEAVVVENSPLNTQYDQITALGMATIKLLETYLHDGDMVGVSMGTTLHNVCTTPRQEADSVHCTFVPILGGVSSGKSSGRSANAHIHSNQIALEFARLFGGEYVQFYSPAIFSDKNVLQSFLREPSIQSVLRCYEDLRTVITGVGIPHTGTSTILKSGYITAEELQRMKSGGMVGDMALQFFDKHGDTAPYQSFNERVAGIPLSQLRTIENKICVGSGKSRAEAMYGALQGGYINILVTDEDCALRLIEMKEAERDG